MLERVGADADMEARAMSGKAWFFIVLGAAASPARPQAAGPTLEQGWAQVSGALVARSPEQGRLDAINREILVQWGSWNGVDDRKKQDILRYRILPLAAERDALASKLQGAPSSPASAGASLQAERDLDAMRGYFPARLAELESRLRALAGGPWPPDFAAAQRHYVEDVQPPSDERRAVIDFLRAQRLPCAADAGLTQRLRALYAKYGKYRQFLAYLHDVFRGGDAAGVPFVSGLCLETVRALLRSQSWYAGPSFGLFSGSCNEAIAAARAAGVLREGLDQSQIEAYARRGPVVALIGGGGESQHAGIVAWDGEAAGFFSNSLGTKKVEPLSGRMGSITGIVVLE
jgi:hypothetical protein